MFNSSQRFPPGKCHPGTREQVIETLKDWIMNPTPDHKVVWLYGPAGSGKSSIAQSVAELLWELYRAQYGGSFFFAAGDKTGRGDGNRLFSTLAYQLAVQFPSLLSFVSDALMNDPTLPTKSMDVQLKALIIDPILQASSWPEHAPTIIIDGLDECADSTTQTNILSLISSSIRHDNMPLRFLIASRPEYWIRDSFEVGPMHGISLPISLIEVGDANRDIETYLMAEFAKVYKKYSRFMSSVKQPWPSARIVKRFVEESSGQFIYASTIVRFVGYSSDFCDPLEQLRILTTAGPHRATAFSTLDALYAAILSRIPDNLRVTLKLILGGAMLDLSVQAMQIFLEVEASQVDLILDALSALIELEYNDSQGEELLNFLYDPSGPLDETTITFCHLSFREFLQSDLRSGQYFVDITKVAEQFRHNFFELVGDAVEQKPDIGRHPTL
ncbi:hypothetical protein CVT25_000289 [Psilocybe cyanescens]|uniref:NACHT domain-containing protein n=1 Tax=Psilocybe cyanescens TaxID=93625 RepID=A0A409XM14_PSICY|nr:hypothetical protein CVT25_000289 [Psilocybe cyanescens]